MLNFLPLFLILSAYSAADKRLFVNAALPTESRKFMLAHQLMMLEGQAVIADVVRKAGLPVILMRLHTGEWYVEDVFHTIRLGLCGGGMPALNAMAKCRQYVDQQNWKDNALIAAAILGAARIGASDKDDLSGEKKTPEPELETAQTMASEPTGST